MSHRMCAKCKTVINNRHTVSMKCPRCGSLEMANPSEHNDEWAMIYKLQFETFVQASQIKELEAILAQVGHRSC